jgi:hypothetical protein
MEHPRLFPWSGIRCRFLFAAVTLSPDDPQAAARRSTLRKNRNDAIDPHGKRDRLGE